MEVNQLLDKWGERFEKSQLPRDGFVLALILSIIAPDEEKGWKASDMANYCASLGRMTKSEIESAMREAVVEVNLTRPASAAMPFDGIEGVAKAVARDVRKNCVLH